MYTWHKIDGVLPDGLANHQLIEVVIAGKRIGLVKKQDAIHAFAATCPHAGAPLCEGWVNPLGRIVCPLHKYLFDPANGRNTSGEGYKLFTYPIEIRGAELYIGLLPAKD